MNQRVPPRAEVHPVVLREVAISKDYSEVRSLLELVDTRPCHVLAYPPFDYLWIDVERGCALMARESYTAAGVLEQRFELTEHREIDAGIWLPMRLRNIQFDCNARTKAGRDRRIIDTYFSVEEIAVNSVPDQLFDFRPSPGALLLKDDFRPELEYPRQEKAGGLELVDEITKWMHLVSHQESRKEHHWWLIGFLAIPVVTYLEARRRWQQRKV
jgi:hypothetical protein